MNVVGCYISKNATTEKQEYVLLKWAEITFRKAQRILNRGSYEFTKWMILWYFVLNGWSFYVSVFELVKREVLHLLTSPEQHRSPAVNPLGCFLVFGTFCVTNDFLTLHVSLCWSRPLAGNGRLEIVVLPQGISRSASSSEGWLSCHWTAGFTLRRSVHAKMLW